jgi:hypothetical protein
MRKISRPSPAMVVALIALFVALGGSGYAALSGKDKKKIRNIADQEIAAKAAGLSVANAANAQNAANAANAQNAANAASATNAANAANAQVAQNANTLDGIDSGGFVRSFGGRISDISPAVVFSVPELQLTILGDTSAASSANFRVRNDASSGNVEVANLVDHTDTIFQVLPTQTSANRSDAGPLVATAAANPDLMLIFNCAQGIGGAYCFGQLMRAPAS